MAENHGDATWLNAAEVAARLGVDREAVHRRMHEGLLVHKHIGNEGALPHFHPDLVDEIEQLGGLPYRDLEHVEAGGSITQPTKWLRNSSDGAYAFVATRIMRIGRAPVAGSRSGENIGGDLPPERWRVVGPGDLIGEGEELGLEGALASGAVAKLPANRGIVARLLELERAGTTGEHKA